MEDKLKMIKEIALNKAVEISADLSKLETGSCVFSQACDDLKDLSEVVKNVCKVIHYHSEDEIVEKTK